MAAIGIDLGTTYSCVAVYQHGKVEIIANGQGNRTTPSYVAYTENSRIIGDGAKSQATVNPKNTIFDSKRLIGRKFNDPQIQEDIKHWPFVVEDDGRGKPVVSVEYKGKEMKLFPEEISAAILKQLKETAEKYLGKRVENAVITVPAYFNDAQRQSTKEAGAIAELNVMRIINEPTAAALAYGFDEESPEAKTILIFDLGGGTFDVSILNIEDGIFEVKSTSGDTHLGGEDFTDRLVVHFVKEFRMKHNKDLTKNQKALGRLRVECERIKRSLSSCTEENIDIDSLAEGIDFRSKISRAKFDDLNEDLFKKVLEPVERALKDAKIPKGSINDIVLVGGSSRIIKVQKLLQEFFEGRPLNLNINPDEAIAHGAAIQAAKMSGDESEALQDIILLDVTPLSLGIRVVGEVMDVIVPRNTPIPTTMTKEFTTHVDNQAQVDIEIFEGERPSTRDNNSLGKFNLAGIPPQKRQVPKIDVTFDVNVEGILDVTAVVRSNTKDGSKQQLRITNDQGRLSKAEIDRMTHDAAMFAEDDKSEKERVDAKLKLENICLHMKSELTYGAAECSVNSSNKDKILRACSDNLAWLEAHQNASKEEYEAKTENFTYICKTIFD